MAGDEAATPMVWKWTTWYLYRRSRPWDPTRIICQLSGTKETLIKIWIYVAVRGAEIVIGAYTHTLYQKSWWVYIPLQCSLQWYMQEQPPTSPLDTLSRYVHMCPRTITGQASPLKNDAALVQRTRCWDRHICALKPEPGFLLIVRPSWCVLWA